MLSLHPKTKQKLINLKQAAEESGEYRVAKRIHAVLLNSENYTGPAIAELLHAHRSKVSEWLKNYETHGEEALLEGHRSGRPSSLNVKQIKSLSIIIDNGPVAYGFTSAVWSSLMIGEVIENEFDVQFHPGHVRKILKSMDYSMQKPMRVLARAGGREK